MPGRTLSLLARCFAGAACCLATTAARADDPIPKNPTALSVEVVVPNATGPAPKQSAPAAPAADTGSSILADTNLGVSHLTPQTSCPARAHRFYVSGEYLMWWFNTSPQPVPLVTSVPAALVPPGGANPGGIAVGSLLDPNASVVLGGRAIDTGLRSGARFTIGTWLDDNQRLGFEGNYFFIAPTTVTRSVSADGSANAPLLSIPFFDVTGAITPSGLPGESARPIPAPILFMRNFPSATPGETAGVFTQSLQSQLQGFELNGLLGLSSLVNVNGLRLNAIGGFRYLNLRESLTFSSNINAGPTGLPGFSDVIYNTVDAFTTHNDFYGGQMGLRGEYAWNRIVMQATAKVALGDVRQQAAINGSTVTNLIGGPGTPLLSYAGGIFAQPSNIGSYSRDRFGVLPEFDVNVGYQVFDWARVFVGYSFVYLSNVTRPGNAIDRNINATGIPFNTEPTGPALVPTGPAAPLFNFHDSSFWAQGITFGLEFRF